MSYHPLGLVVFIFLTVFLVLLFAAGLCERELRREEMESQKGCSPATTIH
jgi:hypothetical protein